MTDQDVPKSKSRRRFVWGLGAIALAWIAAGLYPIYRFLSPRPEKPVFGEDGRAVVDRITAADVAAPGTGKNGAYGNRGLIVLRDGDARLKAFDSKCTHAGCNVAFEGDRIYCNCHGGTYDLDGKNIAGPPPRPLTELGIVEEDGVLYVFRLDGRES